jgi:hypothetical protein
MFEISRMTPRAAPASSVTSGVLRFMWGPTHLEARRVQYCAEVSQFPLTPGATWRAAPGQRFSGQAGGGHRSTTAHGSPSTGTWRRPDLQRQDPGSRYTRYSTRVQQMMSRPEPGGRRRRGGVPGSEAGSVAAGASRAWRGGASRGVAGGASRLQPTGYGFGCDADGKHVVIRTEPDGIESRSGAMRASRDRNDPKTAG